MPPGTRQVTANDRVVGESGVSVSGSETGGWPVGVLHVELDQVETGSNLVDLSSK